MNEGKSGCVKEEVYRFDRRIESSLKHIENSDILEENKQKIFDFYHECIVRGYSKARILKYLSTLLSLAKLLGKPFVDARKEDIIEVIAKIEQSNYSDWTKHDFKSILKVFFKWLRKTEDYPEEVRWIKVTSKSRVKLPEELLTVEEVLKMVNVAEHIRDKAFVLTLYESGCRIGELLTLQIKHVHFDKFGATLIVNGKTGQRRVRVILSTPKLNQWIENHPLKDNPNAPLWITLGKNKRVWRYSTAKDLIKKLAEKAGIKKRVYPHLFRHSRATYLANYLTEAQMKQYFGWVQGSEMASIYVHLSGRDLDKALLRLNGLEEGREQKEEELKPLICPRCKNNNSPDAKFCSFCGMCLDAKTSIEIEELRNRVDQLLTELIKNPEVLEVLVRGLERVNSGSNLSFSNQIINNGSDKRDKGIQKGKDGSSLKDNR